MRRGVLRASGLLLAACVLTGCRTDPPAAGGVGTLSVEPSASEQSEPVPSERAVPPVPAKPSPRTSPRSDLLHAAPGGDGDSWHDTAGREYRLGLVNTPESGECYGAVATRKRKALVAGGFRAQVYTHDTYGRSVAVVTLPDGTNLNVYLARHGYANDKYLAEFRHENPHLASQLDVAFAAAKRERAGLWSACAAKPQQPKPQPFVQQPTSSCHPDYLTCIPIKGDGSGRGSANDLDCPDIGQRVQLRQIGVDPYRLDADGNGIGCESY